MSKGTRDHYFGRAGHLAAMSEFLLRRYNVAIPEVDEGDDILILRNQDGLVRRVQVKSATARRTSVRSGAMGIFTISRRQLERETLPSLCYVLALRCDERWDYVVIERRVLLDKLQEAGCLGNASGDRINLTVRFEPERVMLRGIDLQPWRNCWQVT